MHRIARSRKALGTPETVHDILYTVEFSTMMGIDEDGPATVPTEVL